MPPPAPISSVPEQIPWVSRAQFQNGVLSLSRNESDSGCLCIPFPIEGRGEVALATGTLMERFAPYHLTVELARGKINQLRTQIVEWQALGMMPKEHHLEALRDAMGHLSRAVTSQSDPTVAAEHAELAIRRALDLTDLLTAVRQQGGRRATPSAGTKLCTGSCWAETGGRSCCAEPSRASFFRLSTRRSFP